MSDHSLNLQLINQLLLNTAPIFNYSNYFGSIYPDFDLEISDIVYHYDLEYLNYTNLFHNKLNYYNDLILLNYKGTHELSLIIAFCKSF